MDPWEGFGVLFSFEIIFIFFHLKNAMDFKCLLLVFEKEEDKVWVMGNRP